jgi:hypothetical protein
VIQDNSVNLICINTYNWTEADAKWHFCGRRRTKEEYDIIVHISCTNDEKTQLKTQPHIKFIEDDG